MDDEKNENQDVPMTDQPDEVGQSGETDWQAKAGEYEAGWKRAMADLDNYRKDAERRNIEMVEFLKAGTVVRFLDIYDDLKRAIEFVPEGPAKTGLTDVQKKFKEILRADGLEEIELSAGAEFDPNMAEAISHEEHEVGEGKVIETVEVGLKVKDRVIKPAKVRVAK